MAAHEFSSDQTFFSHIRRLGARRRRGFSPNAAARNTKFRNSVPRTLFRRFPDPTEALELLSSSMQIFCQSAENAAKARKNNYFSKNRRINGADPSIFADPPKNQCFFVLLCRFG